MSDVVVVGDVMVDVVVRPRGPLRPGTDQAADIAVRAGGSAANVACWAASHGVAVTLAARVGASDHVAQVADLLVYGVEARLARDPVAPTGRVVALVDDEGERSFYTDRGANAGLCAADLPGSLLAGARLLHVSGHALTRSGTAAHALMRAALGRGVGVSADAGSAGWLGGDPRWFLDQVAGCQLLFANSAEAALLWPDATPALPGGIVVVTRGRLGAVAYHNTSRFEVGSRPAQVIDTVGAGDAFVGGFLAARSRFRDVATSLHHATEASARAVRMTGGRPQPAQS